MRRKSYGRRLPSYSAVVSTLALIFALAALCVGGAMATGVIVTSKQIKNGSILTQDIHKGAVKSSDIGKSAVTSTDVKNDAVKSTDIAAGAVQTADIGDGQVQPGDVTMPDPEQLQESDVASANVGIDFGLVDIAGTYAKEDPNSILQVDWAGTAAAPSVSCIFQLRVDGQPSANGAGTVFVATATESTTSVAVTALFENLPTGPHSIEVWARSKTVPGSTDPCVVGPANAGISQTFVVSEQVV